MSNQLTQHFTEKEMTRSETAVRLGLSNACPADMKANLKRVADALEIVRAHYGLPLHVSSCYRSPEVNKAVGGSPTSAHRFGCACDFEIPGVPNIDVCRKIPELLPDFDQVIYEFGPSGWVHLGLRTKSPRRQMLSAVKVARKTVYLPGIVG